MLATFTLILDCSMPVSANDKVTVVGNSSDNGTVVVETDVNVTYKTEVHFHCDAGYHSEGAGKNNTCDISGNWQTNYNHFCKEGTTCMFNLTKYEHI